MFGSSWACLMLVESALIFSHRASSSGMSLSGWQVGMAGKASI